MCIKAHKTINGMVLLEVMIASSLAIILIVTLTSAYLKFHQAMLKHQYLLQQQIEAEKLITLLNAEIKSAMPAELEVYADRLVVRYQAFPTNLLLKDSSSFSIEIDDSVLLHPKQWVIISNPYQMEKIFISTISHAHGKQIIHLNTPLKLNYKKNSEVGRYVQHDYHLENQTTLVRIDGYGRKHAIANDIESLQLSSDEKGVHYQFVTHAHDLQNKWVSYAEKK